MPVLRDTAPVKYPTGNPVLVKYLDLTKFISLIQRQALFFCRLDKLEDKFEGTTPKMNYEYRLVTEKSIRKFMTNVMGSTAKKADPTDEESIIRSVQELYDFEGKKKALNCVNCWNYGTSESAALWKIYADFGKGIMLRTSLKNIETSLSVAVEDIRISEITYIDYENDIMPDHNSMYPIIHKDIAYSYETEVRLIYEIIPEIGWDYDWSTEEVQEGKYITVNISQLIDEIILAPSAPDWYFKLVQGLCLKYDLNKTVRKSRLSITDR
jgi:hypothetical protein